MLSGQVEGKISKKFQVALPKGMRNRTGSRIIVTKSIDSCLMVVSWDNWETLLEGTKQKTFLDKATRELQRYLFGNALEITLDNQGRFLIPHYLREYAKLKDRIYFIGVQRYIEIWDKKTWDIHQESIEGSVDLLTIDLTEKQSHE